MDKELDGILSKHFFTGNDLYYGALQYICSKIVEDDTAFDRFIPDLATYLPNFGVATLVGIFSSVIKSERQQDRSDMGRVFLFATGHAKLYEKVSQGRSVVSELVMGNDLGGERIKHFQRAWPIVANIIKKQELPLDEKKVIQGMGTRLITLAGRGPLQAEMLKQVLDEAPGHLDAFKSRGGWLGIWTDIIITDMGDQDYARETFERLVEYGAVEQKDKNGHLPIEKIAVRLIGEGLNDQVMGRCRRAMDILLEAGFQWEAILQPQYEQVRDFFYAHPRLKAHRLAEVAGRSQTQIAEVRKPQI